MILMGYEVPTFLVVKLCVLGLLAFGYGMYREYAKGQRGADSLGAQHSPPKHMGEAEEVAPPKIRK